MELHSFFGLLSGFIFGISAVWYASDVYKNLVTVSIAAFMMSSLVSASQLVSLIIEDVWGVVPFTNMVLLSSITVSFLALRNNKIYFKFSDKVSLLGAAVGFIFWILTKDAAVNIYILAALNLTILTPLVLKCFKNPNLESIRPWQINLLASILMLFTIDSFSSVVWIIPLEQIIFSILLNLGLYRGKKSHTGIGKIVNQ